ncbi:MAG: hypothetical protein HY216_16995 [Candidatus Rokubacteria bacterium]|nr:hypothetical protein [Candidatus Rokubacteria bacterium]
MLVVVLGSVLAGLAVWTMASTRSFIAGLLGLPEAQSFGDLARRLEQMKDLEKAAPDNRPR